MYNTNSESSAVSNREIAYRRTGEIPFFEERAREKVITEIISEARRKPGGREGEKPLPL